MLKINPSLQKQEIEYVFYKFDENGDCVIDFQEFTRWLEKNNVQMTTQLHSNQDQFLQKKQTIFGNEQVTKPS